MIIAVIRAEKKETVRDNPRIGKALASGDWRTQKDENALVGELGTELVVYGNKYWTVGDTGAEFTHIPKGAIVFNHKQTEEILKNGYVTSDGGMLHGTPQHPELVLNAHDTENLLDATNLAKMINDGIIKTSQIPIPDFSDSPIFKKLQETMEVNNIKNDYNIRIDKFVDTIEMNGVNDLEEFEKQLEDQLVKNPKIQKIIQEETIGQMLGNNSMKKYIYVHH